MSWAARAGNWISAGVGRPRVKTPSCTYTEDAGAKEVPIMPHSLVLRITGVAAFFLLLALLLWRRGHRS